MRLPPEAYSEFERLLPAVLAVLLDFSYDKLQTDAGDTYLPHPGISTCDWLTKYDKSAFTDGTTIRREFNIGFSGASALQARLDRMLFLINGGEDGRSTQQQG